ncbi:MAG: CpsD/CapB family tyrosine-protein kinase [Clostridia bacterium]|nr:CpsD/CapB family tyrosine-protein kinase [Clostridia bacterium]
MADEAKRIAAEKDGSSSGNNAFQIAEAYRTIRTNLLFTLANTDNRVVVFSSAEPGAGKSTLSANMAIVMAQTGAKVLLIDADMRKPRQHRNFRCARTEGLSKVLGGISTLADSIQRQLMPNLDLLPAGPIPPNPSELLGSQRMNAMLEELKGQYDYIFIDTPPMTVVTDALLLLPQTAGAVLVARQRQTAYDELKEVVESIKQIEATLLGVVLADVQRNGTTYYKKEKYRYYRSYGYEYVSHENEG